MVTLPGIHRARPIRHHAAVVCSLLIVLIAAAPAAAQGERCQAPPGRSGIEQYCEALPQAGGPQGGGRDDSAGVDRGTAERLRSAGPAGAAVLGLTGQATGDSGNGDSGTSRTAGGGSGSGSDEAAPSGQAGDAGRSRTVDVDEPSDNLLSALRSSVEEGPTLSGAFAWVLIAIALACFALAWTRWRRDDGKDAGVGGSAP